MVSPSAPIGDRPHRARKEHRGVVVPMVTPFTEEGDLDEPAVRRIVDHLLDGGADGFLLLGTTGEGASMSAAERLRRVETAVERIAGRAQVYVGISDDSLKQAIEAARACWEFGVDGLVAHLPSYYPLGPREIEAWFERLADDLPGPLFLYNIPMTTKMSIPIETVEALSAHPLVAGIKDSERDAARMEHLIGRFKERVDFSYFVGPSALALEGLSMGADGFVPGAGNVMPEVCRRLMDCVESGDREGAEEAQQILERIGDAYQSGRPIGVAIALLKEAMHALGLCQPHVLPPLVPPAAPDRRAAAASLLGLSTLVSDGP